MFTIEEMLSKRNQRDAFEHFKTKHNGCGADGIPLSDLDEYWRANHQKIEKELKNGTYRPGIIKCTEIINNRGKRRIISTLCTIDSFISRLLFQKLRRYIEPEFLANSFAYQENKGILGAVQKAQAYIGEKAGYVAEIDIKDYFDSVPHDKMMELIEQRISDQQVLNLISKYLHCNITDGDKIIEKTKGLVQGNPISTVLSNLYLHSLDMLMEKSGYQWIRFADNIYVYFNTEEKAVDAYNFLVQYIEKELLLFVNSKKSGIYSVMERPILGYEFYKFKGRIEVRKCKYHRTEYYHNWHESALQTVNHEYHIIQNGVLNKKDYSLIFENEKEKNDIPVGVVDQINIYSDVTIASNALRLISEKNIRLSVVDKYGNLMGNYVPSGHNHTGTVFLKQAEFYQSSRRFQVAQKLEIAGIHNLRANIKYYNRKNGHIMDQLVEELTNCIQEMRQSNTVDELMLIEARARQLYYSAFNIILKQDDFSFEKRTRRPPMDELNALISFGNTLLYNVVLQEIWRTSLDPRIGIVHATTSRSYSLNLDFADLFKPIIVDRVIFSLINLLQIQKNLHFEREESGATYLNKAGKRIFISEFEDKLKDKIKVKDRNYTYKQLIEEEIHKFQRFLMGNENYKPYKYW